MERESHTSWNVSSLQKRLLARVRLHRLSKVSSFELRGLVLFAALYWGYSHFLRPGCRSASERLRSQPSQALKNVPEQWSESVGMEPSLPTGDVQCHQDQLNIVQMSYPAIQYKLSVHSATNDWVISKSLLENPGTYGTVNQIHSICANSGLDIGEGSEKYTVDCSPGKLFVEVGSALGHVSMYAAARGMRVIIVEPLSINVDRIWESMCVNGRELCGKWRADANVSFDCDPESAWINFSNRNIRVHNVAIGDKDSDKKILITSNPNNFAATSTGGGTASSLVSTRTIHTIVGNQLVELMLLTCQQMEFKALKGAESLLARRKIKNVIIRLHGQQQSANTEMGYFLKFLGYKFYKLDEARRDSSLPPRWLPPQEAMEYFQRWGDGHPDVLASLD